MAAPSPLCGVCTWMCVSHGRRAVVSHMKQKRPVFRAPISYAALSQSLVLTHLTSRKFLNQGIPANSFPIPLGSRRSIDWEVRI